jgi:hypothetical protein
MKQIRSHVLVVLSVLLWSAAALSAQTVFQNPEYDYIVDIPVGWTVIDGQSADFINFADPQRRAVFQIVTFPGSQFATVEEIDRFITQQFSAEGDAAAFRYLQQHAIFADYRFSTGRLSVRGYMVFLNGDEYDFAVMTYVPEEYYEAYHDFLLSAVDSFSLDAESRLRPGPVSAFFSEPYDRDGASGYAVTLPSGDEIALPSRLASEEMRDAANVLIEREARILSQYAPAPDASPRIGSEPGPPWAQAWRRYFRMIYRDSFSRMEPVAQALFDDLASADIARNEMPAAILAWLQSARYERTRSISDLMSPGACLVEFAGDCDSLGLTYAIILSQMGFDAILMVSREFSHALVGVDIPGEGARFPFQNREWLVAELTEEVAIGMIAADMSEIAGWIGVKLDPTVQWR